MRNPILIVSDSRGTALKPILSAPDGFDIQFIKKGGATLEIARRIIEKKLLNSEYTCAYIMAGICSITNKDDGFISLPFDDKDDLFKTVTSKISTTLKELDAKSSTPIVLCTLPGVDLIRANNKNATGSHPQQDFFNQAIIDINDYIVDLNLSRGYTTPTLSAAIHRCHGNKKDGTKKYRHHFNRLEDGVHPTPATLLYWKKRLEENFEQFTFKYELL